ncbi:MAG: hypothetical protein ABL872_09895 [Lacibacter sp.]
MKSCLLAVFLFVVSSATAQTSDSTVIKKDSLSSKPDVEAQFPGGENMWNKYIQKNVEKKIDALVDDIKSRGTTEVEFTVAADGFVSNIKVISLEGSVLADVLYTAISTGPRWIAATKNGLPVESVRKQKATFKVYDAKEERKERKENRRKEKLKN